MTTQWEGFPDHQAVEGSRLAGWLARCVSFVCVLKSVADYHTSAPVVPLCCCRTTSQTIKALKAAGLEVLEACDLTTTADIAWWDPVDPDQWWRLQSECVAVKKSCSTTCKQLCCSWPAGTHACAACAAWCAAGKPGRLPHSGSAVDATLQTSAAAQRWSLSVQAYLDGPAPSKDQSWDVQSRCELMLLHLLMLLLVLCCAVPHPVLCRLPHHQGRPHGDPHTGEEP
jgi:hypothetical protein